MICPNCKKENANTKATECAYCHTPFYSSQEQAVEAVKRIKTQEALANIGKLFAIVVTIFVVLLGAIFIIPNLPEKEPVQNNNNINTNSNNTQTNSKPNPNNNSSTQNSVSSLNSSAPSVNNSVTSNDSGASNSSDSNTDNNYNGDYTWNDNYTDLGDSYEEPETEETTTEDVRGKYNDEIAAENERHQEELERINNEYDSDIEFNEDMASSLRSSSGAYSSASSYTSQISSLESELDPKRRKLIYLQTYEPNSSQTRSLEREVARDEAELEDLYTKMYCAQDAEGYESTAQSLKRNKQNAINTENERHEQAVEEIKEKYNM